MEKIENVIGQHVRLKKYQKNGTDIRIGCCPFHFETAPSFLVFPKEDRFVCLSCGASGNTDDFMQLLHKKDPLPVPDTVKKEGYDRLYDVLESACGYYSWRLQSDAGTEGLEYFHNRGLTDETIKKFSLGTAGRFGDNLIRNLKKWGFSEEEIAAAGLSFQKDDEAPTDRFYGRAMFPLKDEEGRVIGFTGRAITSEAVKKMKYVNTPETDIFKKRETLYGLDLAKQSQKDYFILVEGNMDVISMHQAGFDNAIASCGTALTKQQCEVMKRYKQRVLLMYDADDPGIISAIKAVKLLRETGLEVVVVDLIPFKDPDELIKAEGRSGMQNKIRSAVNATEFYARNADPQEALTELLLYTDPAKFDRLL